MQQIKLKPKPIFIVIIISTSAVHKKIVLFRSLRKIKTIQLGTLEMSSVLPLKTLKRHLAQSWNYYSQIPCTPKPTYLIRYLRGNVKGNFVFNKVRTLLAGTLVRSFVRNEIRADTMKINAQNPWTILWRNSVGYNIYGRKSWDILCKK